MNYTTSYQISNQAHLRAPTSYQTTTTAQSTKTINENDILARANEILQRSSKVSGAVPNQYPTQQRTYTFASSASSAGIAQPVSGLKTTNDVINRADEILKKSAGYTAASFKAGPSAKAQTIGHPPQRGTHESTRRESSGERRQTMNNYAEVQHGQRFDAVSPIETDVKKARGIISRVEQALQKSSQINRNDLEHLYGRSNAPRQVEQVHQTRQAYEAHHQEDYGYDDIPEREEYEKRISPTIAMAYNEALKRSQEVIRKNEEELDRTRNITNERGREINMKSSYVADRKSNPRSASPRAEEEDTRDYERSEVPAPGIYIQPQGMIKPKFVEEYYEDGTTYIGEKIKDSRQGRGEFSYGDGTKYDGEWESDQKSGYGVQMFANGNIQYDGEWKDDVYHGNGILMNEYAERNDQFDYKNFETLDNHWIKYEGEFLNGKMHGLGTLTLFNNERFVGKFKYDKVHGTGVFHKSDGDSISGEWDNNRISRIL